VWVLRLLLDWLPRAVLAPRIVAHAQWYLDDALRRSGYDGLSATERHCLLRAICRAASRTMLFGLLVVLAEPHRAQRLLRQFVRPKGFDTVRAAAEAGGAVVACLHSDCYPALLALQARTFEHASCVVRAEMVCVGLEAGAAPPDYVAQALGTQISNTAAMGPRLLAACVRKGGVVTLPIEAVPVGATRGQVVSLAGHPLRANRGPAWLAVRTGRPLFLATTRWVGRRVLVDYGEPLRVSADLSRQEQVERLTSELYARADLWVRAHPSDWTGWTFLEHYMTQLPSRQHSSPNPASDGKGAAHSSLVRMRE
jgi:lauroyl/myristoyl acyltransferase